MSRPMKLQHLKKEYTLNPSFEKINGVFSLGGDQLFTSSMDNLIIIFKQLLSILLLGVV